MLLGFVFLVMGITIYQEGKTEKALDALRDLSSPRALVIRDGNRSRIPGCEVVQGDYIILAEGDRVPADGVVLWSVNCSVDESLLTGESVAVRKCSGDDCLEMTPPGGDDSTSVFSGTLVVSGQAVVLVKEIGAKTALGRIGKALAGVVQEKTLLEKETGRIVRTVFLIALVLCVVIVVFFGLANGNSAQSWLKGLLRGITLAMAMLPEEFPVVLTVFLALGAWRISKKKVLTRKMTAVETLGAATVLCSDKTGTLTQNRMTIRKLYADGKIFDITPKSVRELPEHFHALVEHAILASQRDPFDAMEKALLQLGETRLKGTEHIHPNWNLVRQYPLSRELLALSHAWMTPDGKDFVVAAKGAPEAIFDLCHLPPVEVSALSAHVLEMAEQGLRVLGVASCRAADKGLPDGQHDFNFKFIGLVGLEDPIRETVPEAVAECHTAGIRVVMITGDYPGTARNIAGQIGLKDRDDILTGPELAAMSAEELRERVRHVNIFARVVPEQKLLIVDALKANGEIVAMTGDGVNDAPALKSSHIGIAMGERGTDVAREASELVLLDDSFPAIVQAVRQGRRIFDNLRKAMSYIISVHIPIAGLSLLPVLFKWDEILFPVHIVFLELIIDPACSVVFEAESEEKNIMNRPPRARAEPLFRKRTIFLSLAQGFFSLAIVLAVYRLAITVFSLSGIEARTLAFTALIVSNLGMILTNRSWKQSLFESLRNRNTALRWVVGSAVVFLGLVIYVPFLQNLFHFTALSPTDLAFAAGAGILTIAGFEIVKLFLRRSPD
jgi:Ca2+-transporting ATPase